MRSLLRSELRSFTRTTLCGIALAVCSALNPAAAQETIKIGLIQPVSGPAAYNGKNTVLLVRNGLSYRMRYRLIIAKGDRVQRTDVCDVATLNRTVENWPYKIDWMGVGGVELLDPKDGDVTCQ